MADQDLDARGLNCPLPILRAKKALNTLTTGQTLRIVATDPGSVKDFAAFAKQTGNQLLESSESNGEYTYLRKKGERNTPFTEERNPDDENHNHVRGRGRCCGVQVRTVFWQFQQTKGVRSVPLLFFPHAKKRAKN